MNETQDINLFLTNKGYVAIPFRENVAGLLLIAVKVNGVEGLFILDTGAGVSIVDITQAERLHLHVIKENASYTGAGAGGLGIEIIPCMGNRVEIGDYLAEDCMLSVMSIEHIKQAMAEAGCEEFLGAIGVDILKPGKAIIDYGTMTLYLLSKA